MANDDTQSRGTHRLDALQEIENTVDVAQGRLEHVIRARRLGKPVPRLELELAHQELQQVLDALDVEWLCED